jgi:hypothetical protein
MTAATLEAKRTCHATRLYQPQPQSMTRRRICMVTAQTGVLRLLTCSVPEVYTRNLQPFTGAT